MSNKIYRCLNCGYITDIEPISSIRCPMCDYKGMTNNPPEPVGSVDEIIDNLTGRAATEAFMAINPALQMRGEVIAEGKRLLAEKKAEAKSQLKQLLLAQLPEKKNITQREVMPEDAVLGFNQAIEAVTTTIEKLFGEDND